MNGGCFERRGHLRARVDQTRCFQHIVDLRIEPANVVIEVVDGVIPPQVDFAAIATNNKGAENQVDASGVWLFDRLDIAELDPAIGGLTATGLLGGQGKMSFSYQGLDADANVTVKLRYALDPSGIDPVAKTRRS